MKDKLVPVPPEEWKLLRDLFRNNWPVNELPYNTIQNYIDWKRVDPKIRRLDVLSLNGTWRENGTFIIIDRFELYFFSLDDSNTSLRRSLELLDWDYSYQISAILDRHKLVLDAVLSTIPGSSPCDQQNNVFHLAKEQAKLFLVIPPEGFRLDKIGPNYAGQINAAWPYNCKGSEYSIKRLLNWNTSVGLFNQSNELIAWGLHSNIGLVGYFHVDEQYRRRGYGELVLRAIAVRLAERGLNTYGTVSLDNVASRGLFEKIGFKIAQRVHWIRNDSKKLEEWEYYS